MAISEEAKMLIRISAENASQRAFGEVTRSLDDLRNTVLKVAAAIGGALALRSTIEATRRWGSEVDSLSDALGGTAREMSVFNYQARVVGITTEDITTAFGVLTSKIHEQADAIRQGKSDFDKFGISVLETADQVRPIGEIFEDIRQKVRELGGGAEALALERALFGRSGGRLHDFLSLTQQDIAELSREAEEFGLVLSDAGVTSIEEFNRQMARTDLQLQGVKMVIASALIPVARSLMQIVRENAGAFKTFGESLRGPIGLIKEMVDRFGAFIGAVKAKGFATAFIDLVKDIIEKAKEQLPKIGEELDKLGPIGWAIKLIATSLALSFAAGLFGGLLGGIAGAINLALAPLKVAAAVGGAGLGLSVGIGLTLGLASFALINELDKEQTSFFSQGAFWATLLGLVGGFAIAIAAGASVPLLVTAGIGITLAMAYLSFEGLSPGGTSILQEPEFWFALLGIQAAAVLAIAFGVNPFVAITLGIGIALIPHIQWGNFAPGAPPIQNPFMPGGFPGAQLPGGQPNPFMPGEPRPRPTGAGAAGTDNPIVLGPGGEQGFMINGQFVPIAPMAHGGAGIVTRPTMFLAGEAGPEPFAFGSAAAGASGNTYVFNIGSVDSRERVDEMADAVAARLMTLTAGVGPARYR